MEDTIITSSDIQVQYEQLYGYLMDYLWEFKVVQAIAYLELAIFKKFPDKDEMLRCVRNLRQEISYTYNELNADDKPEFKDAFDRLEDLIENYEDEGCELYAVQEVIDDPTDVAASDEINLKSEKRPFRIGNITKRTKEERELQEEAANTLSNPFADNEEG